MSADRIRRVEGGELVSLGPHRPPVRLDLARLISVYHVPGLSIAVIDDSRLAWAKGYGVTESGTTTPVTVNTLFQAGSASKTVSAVGAMALPERGQLTLDDGVNTKLTSWKVPANEFMVQQNVTLRRILSHTAGVTVHGFDGYPVDGAVPTLRQILDGEKPATNPFASISCQGRSGAIRAARLRSSSPYRRAEPLQRQPVPMPTACSCPDDGRLCLRRLPQDAGRRRRISRSSQSRSQR